MISSPCFRFVLVAAGWLLALATVRAEALGFATLKANEAILVRYSSTGCFHQVERNYVIRGSARGQMEVYEPTGDEGDKGREAKTIPPLGHFLLNARLDDLELKGLNAYLYYLRNVPEGMCTTVQDFTVVYYRDGVKIGEERLHDGSCSLQVYWSGGKIHYGADRPAGISEELYRSIVMPQLLEHRATKE